MESTVIQITQAELQELAKMIAKEMATVSAPPKTHFTRKQIAVELGIGATTFDEWRKKYNLDTVASTKRAGTRYYNIDDVMKHAQEGRIFINKHRS